MKGYKDIKDNKYGNLTAKEYIKDGIWLCDCDCGNTTKVCRTDLEKGKSKSCGCLKISNAKYNQLQNMRLYYIWYDMIRRCYNPELEAYKNYGGRGIQVCKEWKESYFVFEKWALNSGYNENLTIDRKNVDDNYYPDNCKWSTKAEQNDNRQNTIYITINNITKTLSQWCREYNLPKGLLDTRLKMGWTGKDLLLPNTKDDYTNIKTIVNNEELTLKEISSKYNIPYKIIRQRYKRNARNKSLIKPVQERN